MTLLRRRPFDVYFRSGLRLPLPLPVPLSRSPSPSDRRRPMSFPVIPGISVSVQDDSASPSIPPSLPPTKSPLIPLESRIQASFEVWTHDLKTLLDQAGDRFGDVSWELSSSRDTPSNGDDGPTGERIWGHKGEFNIGKSATHHRSLLNQSPLVILVPTAIIYARAPPAFQARYFPAIQPRALSPLPDSPSFLPSESLNSLHAPTRPPSSRSRRPSSSHSSHAQNNRHLSPHSNPNFLSPYAASSARHSASSASLVSVFSTASTLKPPLHLRVEVTPEMFKSELEFLYTGEGMGEMVEWLNNDKGDGVGGGGLFGLGIGEGPQGQGVGLEIIEGPEDGKRERLRDVSACPSADGLSTTDCSRLKPLAHSIVGLGLHVEIETVLGRQDYPPTYRSNPSISRKSISSNLYPPSTT